MDDKLTPMDDRLKALMKELGPLSDNPQAMDLVEPKLEKFVADLFDEIEQVFRAERNKKVSTTAVLFWGSVKEAMGHIKRRAVEPKG